METKRAYRYRFYPTSRQAEPASQVFFRLCALRLRLDPALVYHIFYGDRKRSVTRQPEFF
ncbi:helix-turn-helix domain-containing protein [Azotobacter sp. CWF10]